MTDTADIATLGGLWREPAGVAPHRTPPLEYGADVMRTVSLGPAVVERRLADGTLWSQGTLLPLNGLGSLVIEGPWLRAPWSGLPGWRASGRLQGSGRFGRAFGRGFGRVDVEILPWSPTTSGLRLARRSPLPVYWSARRVRRYWAAAHGAADGLARLDRSPAS
jgi:hypothetical protein